MGTLDITKTMNYVKTSVNEKKDLFSEDDIKQLDITLTKGEKCVDEESQKGSLLYESQTLKTEKEKILLEYGEKMQDLLIGDKAKKLKKYANINIS